MSDNKDELPPVTLPEPEGTPKGEHGAQVRLTGVARAAARGAAHTTMAGNAAVKAAVEGAVPDGSQKASDILDPPDGSVMEQRVRERGEAERVPTGEDDEATADKTAPEPMRPALKTEATKKD